jgi:tetratricopeptide (TPR) repeat protein
MTRHLERLFVPVLLAALGAGCATTSSPDSEPPPSPAGDALAGDSGLMLLSAGAEALSAGDNEVAAALLDRAVSQGADAATAQFLRGVAHLRLGELPAAREALTAAVAAEPSDVASRCVLARVCHMDGETDEAIAQLDAAIALAPDDARLYTLRGHVELDAERLEAAYADLSKAVDLNPADVDAQRGLAVLYSEAEAPDRSEGAWRTAIHLQPDDPQLHAGLARALRDQDRNEEALAEYTTAASLDPENPVPSANVASTLAALGRASEARRAFEEALSRMKEAGPERAFVQLGLAMAEESDGDLEGAQDSYAAALADDPTLAAAHQALGLLCLDLGDERGALEHLSAALGLGELTAEAALQLALLYEHAGQADDARRCADLLASAADKDDDVALRHAQLLIASDDPQIADPGAALAVLTELMHRPGQSESPALWSLSARALAKLGSYEEALSAVDRALAGSEPGGVAWRRDRQLRTECLAKLESH